MQTESGTLTPYRLDPHKLREYYENEALCGHRQEAMYLSPDLWDRYWHQRIIDHLSSVFSRLEGSSFLEVGCAEGMLVRLFKVYHPDSARTGLDISEGYLKRARREDPEALYVQGDAADLPFADRSFDIVLCAETLEHTADPERVFFELARVASRYVVITVPGRTLPSMILKKFGLLPEQSLEEKLAEPGRGHLHDIRAEDIMALCRWSGLSIREVVVDCFVTVKIARFLRLSEGAMRRLDSVLKNVPILNRHGLVQVIVAGRA